LKTWKARADDEHRPPVVGLWRIMPSANLYMRCLRTMFPGWLSVSCLIVGRLLDGELGRRVRLQAFVRDGRAATDRATVAPVFDPLESPIERREAVPQASGHGVVDSLLCQWLRRIRRIAFGLMVICPGPAEIGQQLLHLGTLRVQ
jgi:hypothetical protein